MATLSINGLVLDVLGEQSWYSGGVQAGRPVQAHIAARVRVPADVNTADLNISGAHIVLSQEDGSRVEGHGLWQVHPLRTGGDSVLVRFEGDVATRQT
jgi:hypothetical protein